MSRDKLYIYLLEEVDRRDPATYEARVVQAYSEQEARALCYKDDGWPVWEREDVTACRILGEATHAHQQRAEVILCAFDAG